MKKCSTLLPADYGLNGKTGASLKESPDWAFKTLHFTTEDSVQMSQCGQSLVLTLAIGVSILFLISMDCHNPVWLEC